MRFKQKIKPGERSVVKCIRDAVTQNCGYFVCEKHALAPIDHDMPLSPNKEIDPALETTLATKQTELDEYIAVIDSFILDDQEGLDLLTTMMQEFKTQYKDYDTRRTNITKPLLESKHRIDDLFKPALDSLKKLEAVIKEKISIFLAAQERKKLKALSEGEYKEALEKPAVQLDTSQSRAREVWDFSVENFDLVPKQYLCVDLAAISLAQKANNNLPVEIPGIKWTKTFAITALASKDRK